MHRCTDRATTISTSTKARPRKNTEYEGKTEEEYDKDLIETCQETEKKMLTYQAIMEKEGIKYTIDDYKKHLVETDGNDDSYANQVEEYGDAYLIQTMYKDKAIEIVKDNATFTD